MLSKPSIIGRLATTALLIFFASVAHADLIDEVIAGSEANAAEIQRGHATYKVSTIMTMNNQEQPPINENYEVWFDYPRVRIDAASNMQERKLYLPDRTISFDSSNLPKLQELGAINFTAIVLPIDSDSRPIIHPRMFGPAKVASIANEVRALRENPIWKIEATEMENGLILLRCHSDQQFVTSEYYIDPNQGYSIVRLKEWALKASKDDPSFESESTFEEIDQKTFVLSKRKTQLKIDVGGKLVPYLKEDVELTSIKLTDKADDALFTIEGLGLPEGGRVQDRVAGIEYPFKSAAPAKQVFAVNPAVAKNSSQRNWIIIASAILVAAVLFIWYSRRSSKSSIS